MRSPLFALVYNWIRFLRGPSDRVVNLLWVRRLVGIVVSFSILRSAGERSAGPEHVLVDTPDLEVTIVQALDEPVRPGLPGAM